MHFAAKNCDVEICKYIIELANKFKITDQLANAQNKFGFTPLLDVCFTENHDNEARSQIADCLIKIGANSDYYKDKTGMSPLHWLAYNDQPETIKVLLAI